MLQHVEVVVPDPKADEVLLKPLPQSRVLGPLLHR
ncbi:hypothetical protein BVRB_5g112180 [Beta vulgaris subsp. vulgaris]|nr:hypothetical protein BVRB_5g112180 [Beta vulgaris subsp. vulgaris]